jgi:hypothetical protein
MVIRTPHGTERTLLVLLPVPSISQHFTKLAKNKVSEPAGEVPSSVVAITVALWNPGRLSLGLTSAGGAKCRLSCKLTSKFTCTTHSTKTVRMWLRLWLNPRNGASTSRNPQQRLRNHRSEDPRLQPSTSAVGGSGLLVTALW